MKITEMIADTIQQLLEDQGGTIKIGRNDLANQLGCVPSQINYVITQRFSTAQGYIVESRRGGGGFIKIIKVKHQSRDLILHIINSIDNKFNDTTARNIISTLYDDQNISLEQAKLMISVMSDSNFKGVDDISKRYIKANIFKAMLINTINE